MKQIGDAPEGFAAAAPAQDQGREGGEFGARRDVMAMTQFGWPGKRSYNDAKSQLNKVNTPHGTIDNQGLGPNNKIPTQDEAVQMIEGSGGKVERIEEGHGPDSVSHHDYPHINYTTADGTKGTIRIQQVRQ